MALSRSRRYEGVNYWPGFVDALSTMLLVIIFLLSVFMLAQFFLSREVTGKDEALVRLNRQIEELTNLLALERTQKNVDESKMSVLAATLELRPAGAEAAQGRRLAGRCRRQTPSAARLRRRPTRSIARSRSRRRRWPRSTCSISRSPRCASSWRRSRTRSPPRRRPTRNRSRRSPISARGSTSRWRRRFRSSIAIARTFSVACGRSSAPGPTSGWWATGSCSSPRCCSTSARLTSARRGKARSTRSPPQ